MCLRVGQARRLASKCKILDLAVDWLIDWWADGWTDHLSQACHQACHDRSYERALFDQLTDRLRDGSSWTDGGLGGWTERRTIRQWGYGLMGQVSYLKCVFALPEEDGLLVKANIGPRDVKL